MKILLAPDKFKGSMSAFEICQNLSEAIQLNYPSAKIIKFPMADGGDGSIEVIANHLSLKIETCLTQDPIGRKIKGHYYRNGNKAFIELASASGIVLLNDSEKNPLFTSTYGTGLMMRDAIENGCTQILLFLGGSATNDGGIGIAQALGFNFFNVNKTLLDPIGANLIDISSISKSNFMKDHKVSITLLCDVENPLYGPNGAAYIYGKQKGANDDEILLLDNGLKHFASFLKSAYFIEVNSVSGIGAAGGVGASLNALMGAELKNGFEAIAHITKLQNAIETADFIVTGEGKLDTQSLEGKVVSGVAKICSQYHKPLYLIVGKNELSVDQLLKLGSASTHAIMDIARDQNDAIDNCKKYLNLIGRSLTF